MYYPKKIIKLLFLNRRDIKNPDGGGAEVYTHEIAKGLVERYNCKASVFSSLFASAEKDEIIDGVRYIRKGTELTVHLWGFLFAIQHRKEFDLIIDEINGLGFFTFFLPNSIVLIYQLYKEFWLRELGLLGVCPYILETLMLKFYKNKMAITVSNSTKEDLEGLGFKNVHIVMSGLKTLPLDLPPEKGRNPTMIFLGRLRPTKRPEDAIEIFKRIKKDISDAQLWMVGRGPDEEHLKKKASGINGITFWGWVDDKKKIELLKEAHILIVPGIREGFGINVIEAASMGTPAIGYYVQGLKDSIIHGETGFLARDMDEMVRYSLNLLTNTTLYDKMSKRCLQYARGFRWDKRVDDFWHKMVV